MRKPVRKLLALLATILRANHEGSDDVGYFLIRDSRLGQG